MNWFSKMMMGRYGGDQLGIAIIILSFVLNFIPWYPARILALVVLIFAAFRCSQKNIYKRQREKPGLSQGLVAGQNFFVRLFKRRPDAKTHKYVKCPKCHTTTRCQK